MQDAFPKLRDGGGFELMKISGTTRNRHLTVIPCPNDGYTINYLKDSATMINHATIYVRPLQRNLSVDPVRLYFLFYTCNYFGDHVITFNNSSCRCSIALHPQVIHINPKCNVKITILSAIHPTLSYSMVFFYK